MSTEIIGLEKPAARPGADDARRPASPLHRVNGWFIGSFIVLLILWLRLLSLQGVFAGGPSGRVFGADFAMFEAGARVQAVGGNPYNPGVLYRTERAWMHQQHLTMTRFPPMVRVGNPPLFLWALQPLSKLPFQPVAWGWIAAMFSLSGVGFLTMLRALGWKRRALPLALFLAMPQTFIGAFYGNVTSLMIAVLGIGLFYRKRAPVAIGLLLNLCWLKPQVALPAAMLLILFTPGRRIRLAGGFALGLVFWATLTFVAVGPHEMALWLHGMLGYSRDLSARPDVPGMAGLYVGWMAHAPRLILEGVALVAALAATACCWWRTRGQADVSLTLIGLLWLVWFLVAPYARFYDESLLALPVLLFLGRDACNLHARERVVLYLLLFSWLLNHPLPGPVYLLPLPLVLLGCWLYANREGTRRSRDCDPYPRLRGATALPGST
ncbi:MAG: glycosyltransferase family 87 protein [Chloroflexota bacterium]